MTLTVLRKDVMADCPGVSPAATGNYSEFLPQFS